MTIELTDRQAELLQSKAARLGLTVEEFIQQIAESGETETEGPAQSQEPFWARFARQMSGVPDDVFAQLPEDGASEHDHYLYGLPKRKA